MRLQPATSAAKPAFLTDLSEDDLVDFLRRNGRRLSADDAAAIEAMMLSTASFQVRNAAAIALLDARHPRLEAAINDALSQPAVAPQAGTLLFCLMEAELSLAASVIPNIVRCGSYEARSELLILTSEGSVLFESATDLEELQATLGAVVRSSDKEAAEVAALALEDIRALPSK